MKTFGLDIETHDTCLKDHGKEKAQGVSWVFGKGEILVTGVYDAAKGTKRAYDGSGGAKVRAILESPDAEVVGARIVYDIGWLCSDFRITAKEVKCSLVDVAIVESVIDEYQKYSLDDLAWKYLHERKGSEKLASIATGLGLRGDFRGHLKELMEAGYKKDIEQYVMSDADQPVRIWQEQKKILTERNLWEPVIRKNKLILVTLMMKQRGVRIDTAKKAKNYAIAKEAHDRLEKDFTEKYGRININSPKQLAELFNKQGVPYRHKIRIKGYKNQRPFAGPQLWDERKKLKAIFPGVKIKKGQLVLYVAKQYASRTADDIESYGYATTNNPSVGAKVMEHLRNIYPVVSDELELKQVTNIITKLLGPEFDRFIAADGKIHPDFNISGARQTSRFSSSAPNMQQVPSKTVLFRKTDHEIHLAKLCRELFIAEKDMFLCKMDYSGQESVIMVHFAVGRNGKAIRKLCNENPDFDLPSHIGSISGLNDDYGQELGRKYSKNCLYGLGYGMQLPTLMETYGWDQDTAQRIMDGFNDVAPYIKETMDEVTKIILDRGYIITLGRKQLHLERYNGKPIIQLAYKGFNKLIQGSGVDMMEEALVKIYYSGLDDLFPLYLTVHDEIVFGVPKLRSAFKRLGEVKYTMEHAIMDDDKPRLSVPIRVKPEIGNDWGHVIDYEENKAKILRRAT